MENKVSIIESKFSLPDKEYSKTYFIEIRQAVKSKQELNENTINIEVDKNFIKKDDFGYLFSIEVQKRTQSDTNGFRGMEDFLSKLQQKIIVYTDETGEIKSIVNHDEIKELWVDSQKEFLNIYRNVKDIKNITKRINELLDSREDFLNLFEQSEIGTLLFPKIYFPDLRVHKQIFHQKFYRDFFGPFSLPLLIKTELLEENNKKKHTRVFNEGIIDEQKFQEDAIKLFFRRLYTTYNLIVDFDIIYSELYDLNEKNVIDSVFQIFEVKVGEVYSFNQIVTVKS
ncbi:hypothetical protein [Aquimarina rubra]|uniref:DUF4263 domain-containing protein n=1 Tax=Aquimarina rubra TaxID=1920033 RepID=A0ABW5LB74_9FLAO